MAQAGYGGVSPKRCQQSLHYFVCLEQQRCQTAVQPFLLAFWGRNDAYDRFIKRQLKLMGGSVNLGTAVGLLQFYQAALGDINSHICLARGAQCQRQLHLFGQSLQRVATVARPEGMFLCQKHQATADHYKENDKSCQSNEDLFHAFLLHAVRDEPNALSHSFCFR